MTKQALETMKAELIAAAEAARSAARTNPSPETRAESVRASAELSAFITEHFPSKRRGMPCRAAQRQAAEHAARYGYGYSAHRGVYVKK